MILSKVTPSQRGSLAARWNRVRGAESRSIGLSLSP